ncbi:MAG: thioesterase, partial [Planctomycetales bacterium]|nr:thioesterase [Planctomycetales bacterium]
WPGRENRLSEPAMTDLALMQDALESALPPFFDRPMALFGYSLGASIALEVARRMVEHEVPPVHLFAAAAAAPQLERRVQQTTHLADDAFLEAIQQHFGGIPPEIAANPELLQVVLPALRADMTIIETNPYREGQPLPCPITVIGGSEDAIVPLAELAAWRDLTRGAFTHRLYPGGHFFIRERLAQVVRLVNERLDAGA